VHECREFSKVPEYCTWHLNVLEVATSQSTLRKISQARKRTAGDFWSSTLTLWHRFGFIDMESKPQNLSKELKGLLELLLSGGCNDSVGQKDN
jgi:hypothetical protein